MTQVSVTPATPTSASAPAAGEAAPVLLQAGQRAEFSARLLAALSALRGGGIPAAPAPTAAEAPALVLGVELAAAPLEDADAAEPLEETPESESDGEAVAPAPDAVAEFAPLALLQLSSDDTPEEPSGGGGEGAPAQLGAEPPAERAADAAAPRPGGGAPQPLVLPQLAAASAGAAQPPDASEPSSEAEPAPDPTAASAPARRAEKTGAEAPSPAPEPAPETAVARGPELATPSAQNARSESAAPAPGRVLPELPVRNEQEIVDQVRFLLNRRGGQASIELHPPQLGQVGLRISVTDHAVRLEITADRLPVAELLHKHLPQLQQALEAQGLQIDRAQVDLRERGGDGRERGGDPGHADARRGRDFDGDGTPRQPSYTRAGLPAYSLGAVDVHA